MRHAPRRFDVFCRVVDHFGDAGVALRLARQLVGEHAAEATLWIDDAAVLARLVGRTSVRDGDVHDGVRLRFVAAPGDDIATADVVVEMFGCGLPERYLDAMERAAKPPVWLVVEYLSAEPWIDAAHALPSPHPVRPLQRWFLFPGFTSRSGGLLRERGIVEENRGIKGNANARSDAWTSLGFPPPSDEALFVSLFCYPNPTLPALLETWCTGPQRIACIVPEGVAGNEVATLLGRAATAGALATKGGLTLAVAPFVTQPAFDRRLAASDLCFVRGEDSFVRAQWAQTPFVWHAYPQSAGTHVVKLNAFLDRYVHDLDVDSAAALRAFWLAFNDGDGAASARAWPGFLQALDSLRVHARSWANALARQRDLASKLVGFARDRL